MKFKQLGRINAAVLLSLTSILATNAPHVLADTSETASATVVGSRGK